MKVEDIIEELISVILEQEQEIKGLKRKLYRIDQYIEFYEKSIKGE